MRHTIEALHVILHEFPPSLMASRPDLAVCQSPVYMLPLSIEALKNLLPLFKGT